MLESRHCGPRCRSGEIGRRKGLKIPRFQKDHAGSIPASGTIYQTVTSFDGFSVRPSHELGCSCGCSSELRNAHHVHGTRQGALGMMGVAHGRGDGAMAQQLAHGDDIRSCLEESRCKGMTHTCQLPPAIPAFVSRSPNRFEISLVSACLMGSLGRGNT